MTAKADLLRALKDRQRSEEVVRAECLGIARKRKMSTEAIARVGVELGVALRTSSPGKPTTVEEAVTSLVRIHFGGLERGSSEANEELEEAAANDENTVSTIYVRTNDTNALFYDEKSGAGEKLKEASSANAVLDSPDQDPQLELDKPDQSVERTTTTDSTRSVRDIHRKTPSQAQPATRNEVDDLKEIIQEFHASFTEFRAEAKDREARYLTKIRLLTEKVSSLESTVSSIEKHATEREEKLMKKLSSLSAKVGDLNMHAKAVRTRTATTGTHTPDTIDHDPPTPPMTNNSTAVGEPTPFPPSNHDHIPAVQRLGLDSDSATGPQPTYADRASCPLSAPQPGKVSSTALAAAAHASHGPIPQSSRAQAPVGVERPHSRSSTGQPVAVGHLRRGVQPLESDDEDDLWTLVSKSKPTGKKAAIYVGNLDDSACEEKLCNFIDRRSKKAGIKSPKIHSCSILRREEGELGSWGAHIVIDLLSLDYICNGNFWPGRIYARPWVFRKKTAPETET